MADRRIEGRREERIRLCHRIPANPCRARCGGCCDDPRRTGHRNLDTRLRIGKSQVGESEGARAFAGDERLASLVVIVTLFFLVGPQRRRTIPMPSDTSPLFVPLPRLRILAEPSRDHGS